MHPILKDRRFLFLYLSVWLVLALMLTAVLAIPGKVTVAGALAFSFPLMLVYAFMSFSAWYVCRTFPLHKTSPARLLLTNVFASFLSTAFLLLMSFGWVLALESLTPGLIAREWHREVIPLLASTGVILYLLAATVTYLITTFETSRTAERTALELQVLAREAELRALRAQIDPHFLFNSLNSISALTSADPRSARSMTVKLADFLRMSMTYGALDTISLEQELSLASRFLDIEKVRFGKRLAIETTLDEAAKSFPVAPLLLQPLVENAVGHGIACLVDGGTIKITGIKIGNQIQITIVNPADPYRKRNTGTGVGIENVRQRLRGLYGTGARIEVIEEPARFTARLSIPVL